MKLIVILHTEGAVSELAQTYPDSTVQVELQPSPEMRLPSSQPLECVYPSPHVS